MKRLGGLLCAASSPALKTIDEKGFARDELISDSGKKYNIASRGRRMGVDLITVDKVWRD